MSNNRSESQTAMSSLNRNVSQGMRDLARAGNYRKLWLVIGLILLAGFSLWAINDGGSELFFQRVGFTPVGETEYGEVIAEIRL